jgi:enoyl-CoA hydratase
MEILCEVRNSLACVTLNRPAALNALSLGMVEELKAELERFALDPGIRGVRLKGAGEKAFCAGGDVRALYDSFHGAGTLHNEFFAREYPLDYQLHRYPKPYIALMNGIVMGGGMGIAQGSRLRVVGDRTRMAMPEVGIGFFPDVGASYFLPRLPHHAGFYLALTGARIGAGDALALGLAHAVVAAARIGALATALESPEPIDAIIAQFSSPTPAAPLLEHAALIEACFDRPSLREVIAALEAAANGGSSFAKTALDAMLTKSATSEAIALRQAQTGGALSFEQVMAMEFRIVSRICRGHDFYEGVRAVIVDKDNKPKWRPATPEGVSSADVDAYFAPLDENELVFQSIGP